MLAEVEELLASQQQSVVGAILQQAVVAGSDGGSSSPVSLFNSLSWSRTAWVKHGDSWIYAHAPPLSVSFAQHAEGDLLVAAGRKLDASSLCIENEFLRVRFDRDGSIASVYDKENLREVLALGSRGNKLAVYHDTGDAWDFPMDYADQTPRYMQLTSYESAVNGPCVEMQQQYQLGKHTTLSQTIRLTAGSRRIDFVTAAHWREPKAMLRTSFPVAVHAEKATYEIQFGAIERPTHRNTTWDLAKDECPAHKWADLSQRDYGVALLNDCKYGYKVKGNELDLNLLRSVVYPRDPLEPKDDCRADGDPVYGHTDQDDHTFTYALYPHLGDHVTGQVVRHGYELNIPLRVADGSASADPSTSAKSLLTVSTEHVVVETVKAAEDLSGRLVFRLYEASGSKVDARIEFGGLVSEAREVNLMEEPLPEAASEPLPLAVSSTTSLASVVSLQFLPFEIKTLLVAMPADGEGAAGTGGKRRKRC
jgi:alpha-mannosidase